MKNTELVLEAFEEGPLSQKQIREWLYRSHHHRSLDRDQINSALQYMKDKEVFNEEGLWYRTDRPNKDHANQRAAANDLLIPCYGMSWYRDQVVWGERELLGSPGRYGDNNIEVNFADQIGVYVLYEWPNVIYVGRTTDSTNGSGLYDRLYDHTRHERRKWFDRFSWFGLHSVDANQELVSHRDSLDMDEAIKAMETILIKILSPPFNDKGGDHLGPRYSQVPEVEKRKQERAAKQISKALALK